MSQQITLAHPDPTRRVVAQVPAKSSSPNLKWQSLWFRGFAGANIWETTEKHWGHQEDEYALQGMIEMTRIWESRSWNTSKFAGTSNIECLHPCPCIVSFSRCPSRGPFLELVSRNIPIYSIPSFCFAYPCALMNAPPPVCLHISHVFIAHAPNSCLVKLQVLADASSIC